MFMKNVSASGSSKSQMLPSSLLVSFFKVLPLPQKINRFHILAPCFTKNASASSSSKSQMLPSSLPLPASFFKVLPLLQKINYFHRFRFQSWTAMFNTYKKKVSSAILTFLNLRNNGSLSNHQLI